MTNTTNNTITLSLLDGDNTYGPTAFVISNGANITIDGSGDPGLVISGNTSLRQFAVTADSSLTLEDVTLENGLAQGGMGGSSEYGGGGGGGAGLGGAVYDDGGAFTAEGVTFTNNSAQGGVGGSIDSSGSNIGGGGGGMGTSASGQSGASGGAGGGSGGSGANGFRYDGGGFGGGGGGGVALSGGPGGGFGGGGGGGFQCGGGGGGFGGGGGGDGYGTTKTLSGATITVGGGGGGGGGLGGALFSNGGTLTLTNDTFTANSAVGGAGGSGLYPGTSGSGYGGAVFVRNGILTADDDTFSSNTAQGGTDVYVLSDGASTAPTATLVDDILGQTNNSVSDFVANSINGGSTPDTSGSSNDLVTNNDGLSGSNIISDIDPQLSPLASNGGPTLTMALTSSSPAYQYGITIDGITTDQRGYIRPPTLPSLGAFDPLAGALTTITASTPTPTLTFTTGTQDVTLDASVSSSAGTVNEGTVTFTVVNGTGETIGTAVSTSITSNGNASVSYGLPIYTSVGSYTIEASYSGSAGSFAASNNASQSPAATLSIAPASTSIAANNVTATFSTSGQDVSLTANVSSSGGTVDEGKVNFTVLNSAGTARTAAGSASVINGTATVNTVGLPANLLVGSYCIDAYYTDSAGNFSSSNLSQSPIPKLSVTAATSITASDVTSTFSISGQDVTLDASVTSDAGTVNEGTVTFTIEQDRTVIGRATTSNVSNGTASVSYALPPGLASGTYTIVAGYNPGPDYSGNTDTTHSLSVGAVSTTVTPGNITAVFNTSDQSLTLSANVTSSGGPVNEGSVTFTVLQNGNIVGTTASGPVSNGQASASYVLPSGVLPGSYTIVANYTDSTGNFSAGAGTASLSVNAAATVVQMTSIQVVPNLLNGTAQVTLTAQVSSSAGSVNAGSVTFTFAGVSAQATVTNGTATVQLPVPMLSAIGNQTVTLGYVGSAAFDSSTAATQVVLSMMNLLFSANATLLPDGSELYTVPTFLAPLELLFTNQQLTEIRYGPFDWQIGYVPFGDVVVVTINGVPWEVQLFGPQGQPLATVPF